jgi:DNA polymerase delta subunit 1
MLEHILDLLLIKNDKEAISVYVKKIVGNLVQNKVDISKLVITKAISKNTEEED